jgi:hypothetical protein
MSFNNPNIPLKFEPSSNSCSYNQDTYKTDFETGRSWIEPQPWLRFYKDGGVSLHGTGCRQPHVRHDAKGRGIDIQTFGDLRGTLTTQSGDKVPRSALRTPPGTVLMEDDRVYPLKNWRPEGAPNPQDRLPPAHCLSTPLAVWQDRSMMPVCSTSHTVHVPSKDAHDKWMDEHGNALKVTRTLGALAGSSGPIGSSNPVYLLNKLTKPGWVLSDHENVALFRTEKAALTKAIMHMTAKASEYEYLILTPS